MTHILFWATAAACLLLVAAVIVTTRCALRTAGRDVTYGTAQKRPAGYTSRHRYGRSGRTITYYYGPTAEAVAFADIVAREADADVPFAHYADLYLVPEETR